MELNRYGFSVVVTVCVTDWDCPSGLACIQDKCQDPCVVLTPCDPSAECKVVDTVPWRTMVCICPNGYMAGQNLQCVKGKPELLAITLGLFDNQSTSFHSA